MRAVRSSGSPSISPIGWWRHDGRGGGVASGGDDRIAMNIRGFAELTTANEQTRRFTSRGLATGGMLSPDDAAEFQQHCIASADLVDAVPESTQQSFERLRTLHSYGVLCYDAFTVAGDLSWVVLEQALRERFIAFYGGAVPLVSRNGTESTFTTNDFAELGDSLRKGGLAVRGSKLKLQTGGYIRPPLTLAPLLAWARREALLEGQRNRRVEAELFHKIRNRFAHGADYHLAMPPDSAGRICDLAEIINRLWGAPTPGGRLYPPPLAQEVLAVGWSPGWGTGAMGSSVTVMRPNQLAAFAEDQGDWTYIVLRAVPHDEELMRFDVRYERTVYPAELLWGPGERRDALVWLGQNAPSGGEQSHLDRLFVLQREDDEVRLPYRADVMLGLPEEHRGGVWHLIRADFPNDAYGHVRHLDRRLCWAELYGGCAVEDIGEGSWQEVCSILTRICPDLQPAPYSDTRVPESNFRAS